MAKKKKLRWKDLKKKGIPRVFWPGIMLLTILGAGKIENLDEYYKSKILFPKTGVVEMVEDGDTFDLKSGNVVRMVGIDSPNRGGEGFEDAKMYLSRLIEGKKIWLEYDRYQDDKFGRIMAWVWVDCEENPKFKNPLYMRLSGNRSNPGLMENPEGCEKGKLVNEEMVKKDLAKTVSYQKRGPLKYEERIKKYKINYDN